jgi:hypothetical protein
MLKIVRQHDALDRGDMKVADTTSQRYETKLVEKLRSGDNAAMEVIASFIPGCAVSHFTK